MPEGWIKLYRSLAIKDLWLREKFTRGQAWVDLLLLANHSPGYIWVRGIKVDILRGQVGYSELSLSKRWHWSRSKTKLFLKFLDNEQQNKQQRDKRTTIITILNYDKYQSNYMEKGQHKEQQIDNKKAIKEQQKDTNKNDNNGENGKNEKGNVEIVSPQFFLNFFNEKFDRHYQLTDDLIIKIEERLKFFSANQILKAIDNLSNNPFHAGDNDHRWHANPKWFFRSDDNIDEALNMGDRDDDFED